MTSSVKLYRKETMRLLDLFCCAGGSGMGYHRAGFDVTGVDIAPQPRYPFAFVQADALEYVTAHGHEYDVIHASPPCQRYSSITATAGTQNEHPDLITAVRAALLMVGRPYIIENVRGAARLLKAPVMLCGTMFGLNVERHRYFECNPAITMSPATCRHHKPVVRAGRKPDRNKHMASAVGNFPDLEFTGWSMGIDWMNRDELAEAIPPAYTEWIGRTLRELIAGDNDRGHFDRTPCEPGNHVWESIDEDEDQITWECVACGAIRYETADED